MQYAPTHYPGSLDNTTDIIFYEDLVKCVGGPVSSSNYMEAVAKLQIQTTIDRLTYGAFFDHIQQASPNTNYLFTLNQKYYNHYSPSNSYDLRKASNYYSFLPISYLSFQAVGANEQHYHFTDLNVSARVGFRVSYSPGQIFWIESLIEYCQQATYSEIESFIGLFEDTDAQGVATQAEGVYTGGLNPDSMYSITHNLKDILQYSEEIGLRPSAQYSSVNEMEQIFQGATVVRNLCNGVVETTNVGSAVVLPNSVLDRNTNTSIPPKVAQAGDIEGMSANHTLQLEGNNTVIIENLYTYGGELYYLGGAEYKGFYHVHSELGPMEGAEHSVSVLPSSRSDKPTSDHSPLKYYYELDKKGSTYKNKTRRANNFQKIYKSIFKIS